MEFILRLERPGDRHEVERLTRLAFWNDKKFEKEGIGCDEHYLVHIFRTAMEYIPQLNYVAVSGDKIVGSILYTMAYVEKHDGSRHNTIIFGPLSVLPGYQSKGVGSALMRHTLKKAAKLGYGSCFVFGHPGYYPRFGFKEAREFGITTSDGKNFPAFMALELHYDDLMDVTGRFIESPLFKMDPAEVQKYDQGQNWIAN